VIADRSLQLNSWDPRVRFSSLEETNGAAFYRYVRLHGHEVLSNDTYRVLEFPAYRAASHAGPPATAAPGRVPQPRHEF
jgi:hypothetical protein